MTESFTRGCELVAGLVVVAAGLAAFYEMDRALAAERARVLDLREQAHRRAVESVGAQLEARREGYRDGVAAAVAAAAGGKLEEFLRKRMS